MSKTIPSKDVDFNERQEVIYSTSSVNVTAWGLDQDWFMTRLTPAKQDWDTSWAAWQDSAQRTPLITFEKNEKRKIYEPLLRILVLNLECNTRVSDD
jgi:hypothetical protein